MPRPTVTSADVAAGAPAVVLAVLGTSSLLWAHLNHHSLVTVLPTALVLLALLALLPRPRVVADHAGLGAVLGAGVLAAVMFLPGFGYGAGDKDPGTYVAHAVEIAHSGSYSFTDPALAHGDLPVEEATPGARFPAMWVRNEATGRVVPQFYHLWASLLATAYDLAGYGGITAATPLCGVVAVMCLVALLRRIGGIPAAVVGGVLVATNMMEVWQAKYPTAEVLAQALFLATLLGIVVAIQERWRPAAFLAGLLVGVGFLNRADGWLLVMLAVATLGGLWLTRRADAETRWGAAGLAVLLPYGLVQAYGTAAKYTRENGVPGLAKTLALIALVVVCAVAGRRLLRTPVDRVLAASDRARWRAGLAVCAVFFVLLVVGFLRPKLGYDYFDYNGQRLRSYDEYSLHRLAWFLTLPGFALAGLGIAAVALRRWRLATWAAIAPTLLLTPVFAYHAHNSTRLMWWARRYVPIVLPGLVVLIALALAFAWSWRRWARIPVALVTAALVAVFLHQSWPLRTHDEYGGSFGVAQRIAALSAGKRGVFLWQHPASCCTHPTTIWATPVWVEREQLSVLLPRESIAPYVDAYRAAFPADPLFVVWDGTVPPPGLTVTPALHLAGSMPFWEESDTERPHRENHVTYDFTVYRVA